MARNSPNPKQVRSASTRCAIYTRKSSEDGLEQEFNSLDAQREACLAYITSQRHEGWKALPTYYDDGGFSGGTLNRPAVQQLLADIRAGRVDLVVIYKVDRLTRSLADFAKLVETFDAHGVSFVSITQHFNTTTSIGRLTLNMLLSFAQFEREVTGERIRDKIAASKRRGMWMGGPLPLGYDVRDRKLVINDAEAETVRHLFRSYLELGSVRLLEQRLCDEGIRSKLHRKADGSVRGGKPLARGALYLMLQNHLYRGEISHKGAVYPGEHPAIIDEALWDAVQKQLMEHRANSADRPKGTMPSLLAGLLYDETGNRLVPSHAVKKWQTVPLLCIRSSDYQQPVGSSRWHALSCRRSGKWRHRTHPPVPHQWPCHVRSTAVNGAGCWARSAIDAPCGRDCRHARRRGTI
ncbi:MAG: recombinase family protein [Pseudolabrys sp.]